MDNFSHLDESQTENGHKQSADECSASQKSRIQRVYDELKFEFIPSAILKNARCLSCHKQLPSAVARMKAHRRLCNPETGDQM